MNAPLMECTQRKVRKSIFTRDIIHIKPIKLNKNHTNNALFRILAICLVSIINTIQTSSCGELLIVFLFLRLFSAQRHRSPPVPYAPAALPTKLDLPQQPNIPHVSFVEKTRSRAGERKWRNRNAVKPGEGEMHPAIEGWGRPILRGLGQCETWCQQPRV